MREKLINITIIIIVALVCIGGTTYYFKNYKVETKSITQKNISISETNTIKDSVDKMYNATVVVENYQKKNKVGYGSGFIYKKEKDAFYVMTNHHVIEDSDELKIVTMDGEVIDAKLLGSDQYMDIAVLKIVSKNDLLVAEIGDSTKMEIGNTVFTVGTPVKEEYMGTVTKGIISGKNRSVTVEINNSAYMMEVLQTDASINPGNSGGPLVNINGEVIGVNSMKLTSTSVEGMGFSIPIEMAMSQIDKLEAGKKIIRPLVGVSLIDAENIYMLYRSGIDINSSIKEGAVIAKVEKGSVADKAGLEKGDVIVEIDNTKIKNTAHFRFMLYKHDIGETMKVKVVRDGKTKDVDIRLTEAMNEE